MEEIEIWKDIPEYEGLYKVSNFGLVKSLHGRVSKERIISINKSDRGYLYVTLCKNGIMKTRRIHQLVAMAFLGHVPDGTQKICVDHIDNNKLNNRLDNLQLLSNRDNSIKNRGRGLDSDVGVHFEKSLNKWRAYISFEGRLIYLGLYETHEEASLMYQKARKEVDEGLDLNVLYPKRVQSSKYEGVSWDSSSNKWRAKYKDKHIGRHKDEEEAYKMVLRHIESLELS